MTEDECFAARFYAGLMSKLYENIFEAYMRTPISLSAKPYLERALHLVMAGINFSEEHAKQACRPGRSGGQANYPGEAGVGGDGESR